VKREDIIAAVARVEAERAHLLAQLIALELAREPDDELLTVGQAAATLSVTTDWLYRHAKKLPFTVRPGAGQVRFSRVGIQDYVETTTIGFAGLRATSPALF